MSADAPRTPGQLAWLVGAAGVVLVLVVGGGWLAWRGLSHARPPLTGPAAVQLEVDRDELAFGAPRLVDGVPCGYPLTPQGAAAAATTAVAVTGQAEAVFDRARFEQVAAVVFTPEQAALQASQVAAARTQFELSSWAAQPASRRLYFFAPLAVRLTDYDPHGPTATVEVWAMTLVGVGDAGGAVFTTSTVELTVADDRWVVSRLDSTQGPTPLVQDAASAPGLTRGLLRDAQPTLPLPLPDGRGR